MLNQEDFSDVTLNKYLNLRYVTTLNGWYISCEKKTTDEQKNGMVLKGMRTSSSANICKMNEHAQGKRQKALFGTFNDFRNTEWTAPMPPCSERTTITSVNRVKRHVDGSLGPH
ncbi:hypothetical protein DICVIV_05844 [Dictyocaulus viviparus]|uniref:Uncharacterized protein n=1 Tax=Dictyocaulus viviparus TaxID=29172 RepID=A0A0D8XW93_DICVI|nr:hypothetical protein DICVIV_05844 [Dictyocaulus viviparus]